MFTGYLKFVEYLELLNTLLYHFTIAHSNQEVFFLFLILRLYVATLAIELKIRVYLFSKQKLRGRRKYFASLG